MSGWRRRDFLGAAAAAMASAAGRSVSAIEVMLPVGLLRLRGPGGIEGYCLGVSESSAAAIKQCAPVLISADPLDRERIWHHLTSSRVMFEAIAAIDIALWDLAGKILNLPAFRVAGGLQDEIPVCKVGARASRIDNVAQQARQARDAGYAAFLGRFIGPEISVSRMAKAVRDAAGEGVALIHSAGGRYDRAQALRVGRALERSGYELFDEPLPSADRDGVSELAKVLDISIASPVLRTGMARALVAQSPDVPRIEAIGHGGFTGLLKSLRAAEAFGVPCAISGRGPLGGLVHTHAIGAVRSARFFQDGEPAAEAPLVRGGLPAGPNVRLTAAAGFGLNLDWPEVERRTKRVLRA